MERPARSGRVVITGLGAVTPIGIGTDAFWNAALSGKSGGGPVTLMDATDYPTKVAAEVRDFQAENWLDKKEARRVDRFLALAAAAAQMAMDDACFPADPDVRLNTGVLIGSGIGGLTLLSEQSRKLHAEGPGRITPFLVPYMIPDMASGFVSIIHGLKGPNTCVVSACATGADAIGTAARTIQHGDAVAMVCGGTEAPINEIGMAGFCAARTMTTRNDDPEHASRPFDKDRDGFMMGEGAGVFVLEDLDFARARGARIYGEIVGYGMSGDAHHITAPDPNGDGAVRAMRKCLAETGAELEDVGYINAHGTSTPLNDKTETLAIKTVFGEHAYKVPVSSTKSMIGHTLGAAGAIEALTCVLALRDQVLPPTINYDQADPECDLDYVPNHARKTAFKLAISNSFGFGGHNVTLAIRTYDE
ncbi:MAG: beta-ketoacyl-ACP synthase II [Fimbriimonadaceae bacterium]|nr:beta-ketoacyl-ACP synthase II [Fimbriimonadaceae bacterium]QYK55938.1 MAG: beta-ketoacyl-ACP synthase II [Fimbriimonadaceae bacterium]